MKSSFYTVSKEEKDEKKNKTLKQTILIVLGLLIICVCSTGGELVSFLAGEATCKTSGCVRTAAIVYSVILLIMPVISFSSVVITFFLSLLGLHVTAQKEKAEKLISIALSSFTTTSLLFYFLTTIIYAPGYQTDLRFLAFTLTKAALLIINISVLLIGLRSACKLSWTQSFIVLFPSLFLFGGLFFCYYVDAQPFLHYLLPE